VFRDTKTVHSMARLKQEGRFRRPLTDSFAPTTAEQVIAAGSPAFVFSATTPVAPLIWARAYDAFAEGRMDMKARLLSAITVMNEQGSPELDRVSLRRWLLETPLMPQALLPGGRVRWEAVDETSARMIVEENGISAAMIAHFATDDGRLTHMTAEEDGDLTTPYHGSGEHVARTDYVEVQGRMIPMGFVISRAAQGRLHPFWDGKITSIAFD
jgi:hypothetical protein